MRFALSRTSAIAIGAIALLGSAAAGAADDLQSLRAEIENLKESYAKSRKPNERHRRQHQRRRRSPQAHATSAQPSSVPP